MGETSERFMEGWRAFERGEPLCLYLGCDTEFADGWLEAFRVAFGIDD